MTFTLAGETSYHVPSTLSPFKMEQLKPSVKLVAILCVYIYIYIEVKSLLYVNVFMRLLMVTCLCFCTTYGLCDHRLIMTSAVSLYTYLIIGVSDTSLSSV